MPHPTTAFEKCRHQSLTIVSWARYAMVEEYHGLLGVLNEPRVLQNTRGSKNIGWLHSLKSPSLRYILDRKCFWCNPSKHASIATEKNLRVRLYQEARLSVLQYKYHHAALACVLELHFANSDKYIPYPLGLGFSVWLVLYVVVISFRHLGQITIYCR